VIWIEIEMICLGVGKTTTSLRCVQRLIDVRAPLMTAYRTATIHHNDACQVCEVHLCPVFLHRFYFLVRFAICGQIYSYFDSDDVIFFLNILSIFQAMLINLLLRNYIHYNQYELADKVLLPYLNARMF
jgi:hypothetical protein